MWILGAAETNLTSIYSTPYHSVLRTCTLTPTHPGLCLAVVHSTLWWYGVQWLAPVNHPAARPGTEHSLSPGRCQGTERCHWACAPLPHTEVRSTMYWMLGLGGRDPELPEVQESTDKVDGKKRRLLLAGLLRLSVKTTLTEYYPRLFFSSSLLLLLFASFLLLITGPSSDGEKSITPWGFVLATYSVMTGSISTY